MIKVLLLVLNTLYVLSANDHEIFMGTQEIVQGIPTNLLMAISNVESGQSIDGTTTPWPWTINVDGKGYVFKTKEDAIKAVEKFQKKGFTSIDVGIMQINLHHHPGAFANLQEAFDPQLNIAYAAKFLKQLFLQYKSWHKAICHYHSASPKYYNPYKQKVMNQWAWLCKSAKTDKFKNAQLAQTIIRFDDLNNINNDLKKTRASLQTSIRPFARVKKVFYALDGKVVKIKSQVKQQGNTVNKQLYSLD